MTSRLALFDIDGTLMITKGAGSRCILRACQAVFGQSFEWGPITVGTLDPQIFTDLCNHNAIADPLTHHAAYQAAYFEALQQELQDRREDVTLMPGVMMLLQTLWSRDDTHTGIVTGNYRRAVEIKLAAAGIDLDRFDTVACAEDGPDRPSLVSHAMQQASVTAPDRVTVIGDTPRDIECAQANGCRSLAVATGHYDIAQLATAGATHVLPDLADTPRALAIIQNN